MQKCPYWWGLTEIFRGLTNVTVGAWVIETIGNGQKMPNWCRIGIGMINNTKLGFGFSAVLTNYDPGRVWGSKKGPQYVPSKFFLAFPNQLGLVSWALLALMFFWFFFVRFRVRAPQSWQNCIEHWKHLDDFMAEHQLTFGNYKRLSLELSTQCSPNITILYFDFSWFY